MWFPFKDIKGIWEDPRLTIYLNNQNILTFLLLFLNICISRAMQHGISVKAL